MILDLLKVVWHSYLKEKQNRDICKKYLWNRENEIFIAQSVIFRKPQYIQLNRGTHMGPESELLCWDSYQYGDKVQKLSPVLKIGGGYKFAQGLKYIVLEKLK